MTTRCFNCSLSEQSRCAKSINLPMHVSFFDISDSFSFNSPQSIARSRNSLSVSYDNVKMSFLSFHKTSIRHDWRGAQNSQHQTNVHENHQTEHESQRNPPIHQTVLWRVWWQKGQLRRNYCGRVSRHRPYPELLLMRKGAVQPVGPRHRHALDRPRCGHGGRCCFRSPLNRLMGHGKLFNVKNVYVIITQRANKCFLVCRQYWLTK